MSRCRRFRVAGRVQGVFFRAAARAEARRLGLSGWVRNLADGDVEAVACGDDSCLDDFAAWMWQGPPHARVDNVVSEVVEAESPGVDFVVR